MLAVNYLNLAHNITHIVLPLPSVYDLYVIVAFRMFLECVCISLDTFFAYDVIYIIQICV